MSIIRKGLTRRGVLGTAAATAAVVLGLAGCASSGSIGATSAPSASSSGSSAAGGDKSLVVGFANFPENEILAHLYGGALAAKGYDITYKSAGARDAYLPALKNGEIDLIPEYAGSLLSYLDQSANAKSGDAVKQAIDQQVGSLNATAYELAQAADSDSLNVTQEFAKKNGLTSIGDLKKLDSFTLAANPEFATRPDGIKGLKSVYGLDNVKFRAINDGGGNTTLKALTSGQVQVADIYSTTPSIAENDLVTLTDPKNLFASQQIVPLVSKSKASEEVGQALNAVSQQLTTKDLLQLNREVQGADKTDPSTAAEQWLKDKDLG
ncbi:ABC transporter substrate-binding protein [Amnibacterium endophyticum]|uniref:ABC transporter substrate-binding protein n=1 Tax=Amnibacterium endophyticum TaxID=2109337 RepID=A0ABW4LF96_9MICO